MLGDTEMEKVDCFKYLGLLVSSDMSFSKHIESICSKARKVTGLLYRRFNKANSDSYPIAAVPDNGETTSRICEPSDEWVAVVKFVI